tara:strand:- start:765 stop:1187 length:423 start_codon:yes stop_codon:yes gene_type:complete
MTETDEKRPFFIAIGASAGVAEALQGLVKPIPEDSGFAFVIVTHLARNRKSLMGDILSRVAALNVIEVKNNQELKASHINFMPRTGYLMLRKGKLKFSKLKEHNQAHNPIDVFSHHLLKIRKNMSLVLFYRAVGMMEHWG